MNLARVRRMAEGMPAGYARCAEKVLKLIPKWVEGECQSRFPDLRWKDWGRVCYAGTLEEAAIGFLADSPDARRLLLWLDEQTNHEATLLMAKVALEMLGFKRREHMTMPDAN